MFEDIRKKFGTIGVWIIVLFIAFVFVFYGVFSPRSTRGLHEAAVAGTVNGDSIGLSEFNRSVNRQLEFYKSIPNFKLGEEQMSFVKQNVFRELAEKKLILQSAKKTGLIASDEEVKYQISQIPAFQKEGKFDPIAYKELLQANQLTPGAFEQQVRDDLTVQRWGSQFQGAAKVSEVELKQEFLDTQNQRNVKYVAVTAEAVKNEVTVTPEQVTQYLKDAKNLNLLQAQFDAKKDTVYKGKTFELVKNDLAKDVLRNQNLQVANQKKTELAQKVAGLLKAAPASDTAVNQFLKPYQLAVKSTGWVNQGQKYIPGLGDQPELMKDVFAQPSPLLSKAKVYESMGTTIVALVTEAKSADLTKLPEMRTTLIAQVAQKKQQALIQAVQKSLMEKAKIVPNPEVLGIATADKD